jgi:hypothetical protein
LSTDLPAGSRRRIPRPIPGDGVTTMQPIGFKFHLYASGDDPDLAKKVKS